MTIQFLPYPQSGKQEGCTGISDPALP